MRTIAYILMSFIALLSFFLPVICQDKLSIAILDLEAGVSRGQSQVDGLSDMLTVELHKSGLFVIKERLQVNKVLQELQFRSNSPIDDNQRRTLGEKLKVRALLMGTINFLVHDKDYSNHEF